MSPISWIADREAVNANSDYDAAMSYTRYGVADTFEGAVLELVDGLAREAEQWLELGLPEGAVRSRAARLGAVRLRLDEGATRVSLELDGVRYQVRRIGG